MFMGWLLPKAADNMLLLGMVVFLVSFSQDQAGFS